MGATWGPNDTIVMGSHDGGLWLRPAAGGERTPLTTLSEGEQGHWLPRFLPSGRAVLFFIQTGDRDTGQVGVYDFDTGERRTLLSGTDPGFAASYAGGVSSHRQRRHRRPHPEFQAATRKAAARSPIRRAG